MTTMISDEIKRTLLQAALVTGYGLKEDSPKPGSIKVVEVFPDRLIYDIDGQYYEASYEMGEDGNPRLGDPKRVLTTRTYTTMESLQARYSEVIQEAALRNATTDPKVKTVIQDCQKLLEAAPAPASKKVTAALKEATTVLDWLKVQEATKTEDGENYPQSAFAYAPDADTPSGWKLRMWETPDKKLTKVQLGRAAAALSPGGFRGNKVAIPEEALPGVKRKIRAAYRAIGVEDEDISRWVKEVETRERLFSYVPLSEATIEDKGVARVVVIKAGFNSDKSRFYPADMLRRDYGVFEGAKMYADHPTESEANERPERSIRDWVATLTDVTADEAGTITGVANIHKSWLMETLASLRDKKLLSEMGISINAIGSASKATIEDVETLVVEKLVTSPFNSVDFVTEPGAGGEVTLYEADRNRDIDLVGIAALKERRPDLVQVIESDAMASMQQEVKQMLDTEARVKELEGENAKLVVQRDGLQSQVTEAEKAQAKAVAQAAIKEAVDKAELPEAAKARLIAAHADDVTADGITEAIQSEVDYIKQLAESGKVRGLGSTVQSTTGDKDAFKESMKSMWIGQGKTDEESERLASIAAKG